MKKKQDMKIQKYLIYKKNYNNYKNKIKIINFINQQNNLKINRNQQLHQKNKLEQLKNKKNYWKEKELNQNMH